MTRIYMTILPLLNIVTKRKETCVEFPLIAGCSEGHPAALESVSGMTQFTVTEQVYNYSAPQINNLQTAR
jgi:hypothetical protein